jgi:hypothetical protein
VKERERAVERERGGAEGGEREEGIDIYFMLIGMLRVPVPNKAHMI